MGNGMGWNGCFPEEHRDLGLQPSSTSSSKNWGWSRGAAVPGRRYRDVVQLCLDEQSQDLPDIYPGTGGAFWPQIWTEDMVGSRSCKFRDQPSCEPHV